MIIWQREGKQSFSLVFLITVIIIIIVMIIFISMISILVTTITKIVITWKRQRWGETSFKADDPGEPVEDKKIFWLGDICRLTCWKYDEKRWEILLKQDKKYIHTSSSSIIFIFVHHGQHHHYRQHHGRWHHHHHCQHHCRQHDGNLNLTSTPATWKATSWEGSLVLWSVTTFRATWLFRLTRRAALPQGGRGQLVVADWTEKSPY